jgi:glucarate dehydratase
MERRDLVSSSNLSPIVAVRVTPIAFRDPPLLNVAGVHEPWALRSIIEVQTRDGRVGLGESYGDLKTLADLNKVAPLLVGLDPFELNALTRVVYANVGNNPDTGAQFPPEGDKARASALGAFEVAFLDLQARILECRCTSCLVARYARRCPTAPTCSTSSPSTRTSTATRRTTGARCSRPSRWWARRAA